MNCNKCCKFSDGLRHKDECIQVMHIKCWTENAKMNRCKWCAFSDGQWNAMMNECKECTLNAGHRKYKDQFMQITRIWCWTEKATMNRCKWYTLFQWWTEQLQRRKEVKKSVTANNADLVLDKKIPKWIHEINPHLVLDRKMQRWIHVMNAH